MDDFKLLIYSSTLLNLSGLRKCAQTPPSKGFNFREITDFQGPVEGYRRAPATPRGNPTRGTLNSTGRNPNRARKQSPWRTGRYLRGPAPGVPCGALPGCSRLRDRTFCIGWVSTIQSGARWRRLMVPRRELCWRDASWKYGLRYLCAR